MFEVVHSPFSVLEPTIRLLQSAFKLCVGDFTSLFSTVLLFCIRTALRMEEYFLLVSA
jgi:hypothetical protein